ncbi:MAG: hypothetical protein J2O49_05615 [Sciscionella sp.]|nr:hypothetical protein [Sciscionella sp.]
MSDLPLPGIAQSPPSSSEFPDSPDAIEAAGGRPARWPWPRVLAVGLCTMAAVCAVLGTVLPYVVVQYTAGQPGSVTDRMETSMWSTSVSSPAGQLAGPGQPPLGIPLALAAALLVAAAVIGVPGERATRRGQLTAARVLTACGAGLLAGPAALLVTTTLYNAGLLTGVSTESARWGAGMWLSLAAVLAAVVALVLILVCGPPSHSVSHSTEPLLRKEKRRHSTTRA